MCYNNPKYCLLHNTNLAIRVFPVPGGPYRRIPRGGYKNITKDNVQSVKAFEIYCSQQTIIVITYLDTNSPKQLGMPEW